MADESRSAGRIARRRRLRRGGIALAGCGGAALFAVALLPQALGRSNAVPVNTSLPTINGEAYNTSRLKADAGSWTNSPSSYAFEWRRCDSGGGSCSAIGGANENRYTLTTSDIGHRLKVRVTATNGDGPSAPAESNATALVEELGTAPSNTAKPSVSGTVAVGSTLTATSGSWTGTPSTFTFTYQWQRCPSSGSCSSITSATANTYVISSSDAGSKLRVAVTAANRAGSSSAESDQTGTVPGGTTVTAPKNTSLPTISGTASSGQTLAASTGGWTGSSLSFAYQWQRCNTNGNGCSPVAGATKSQYTLGSSDVDRRMRVRVDASNSAGSASATSDPTAVVGASGPSGAITLPNGEISVPVTSVSLPERLIVSGVQFSPTRITSRTNPVTARFRVTDTRRYAVRGALVYLIGLPYGRITQPAEAQTAEDGWATLTLQPTARMPLAKGSALVLFVRARKAGDNLLAGVSSRRLVQITVG